MFKRFHRLCIFGLISLLLLSLTGRFFAIGDSFAVFRPHMLASLAFLLIIPSSLERRWQGLLAVLIIIGSHARHGLAYPRNIGTTYSIYQKNLFFRIKDVSQTAADIKSFENLDFVTLQEITDRNNGLMAILKTEFPHQHNCPFSSVGGTAILSKWPIIKGSRKCFDGGGMTVVQVDRPGRPKVWVVSTHLNWPYPHSQRKQLERLLPELENLTGPVIIGGDFNMVPWSYTVRGMARVSETRRLPGALITFHMAHLSILGLPIDHILGPKHCTGTTQRRPKLGSDHHGVYGQIACDQKP